MNRYVYHYLAMDTSTGFEYDGVITTDIRVDSMKEYIKLGVVIMTSFGTAPLKIKSLSLLFENKPAHPFPGPM